MLSSTPSLLLKAKGGFERGNGITSRGCHLDVMSFINQFAIGLCSGIGDETAGGHDGTR